MLIFVIDHIYPLIIGPLTFRTSPSVSRRCGTGVRKPERFIACLTSDAHCWQYFQSLPIRHPHSGQRFFSLPIRHLHSGQRFFSLPIRHLHSGQRFFSLRGIKTVHLLEIGSELRLLGQ
jgi:hypothetical protein